MQRSSSEESRSYKYTAVEDTKPEACVSLSSKESKNSTSPTLNHDFESVEVLSEIAIDFDHFKMSNSKYAGVVFTEIQESYPFDGEIDCHYYIVNKDIKPQVGDKIGVFKVCWKNVDECVVSKPCVESESFAHSPDEKRLRFKVSELLRNNTESLDFFQLCYISEEGNVFGASTPFRIYRPSDDDLVEVDNKGEDGNDDGEEFVVIRSEQALMQERLKQLITTNGLLEFSKRTTEQKLASVEKEVNDLRAQKIQCDHKIEQLQNELTSTSERFRAVQEREAKQAEELDVVSSDLVKYRSLLREKEAEMQYTSKLYETFKNESETLCNKLVDLKNECNECKNENKKLKSQLEDVNELLKTRESNVSLLMDEIKRLSDEKEVNEIKLFELSKKLDAMEEMSRVREKLEKSEEEWKRKEEQWKKMEMDLVKKNDELTLRLENAADEYQEQYRHSSRIQNKLVRLQSRVEKYLLKNPRSTAAESTSQQTEVKSLLESALKASTVNEDLSIITLPCSLCSEEICCTQNDVSPMNRHLEDVHKQRVCPVCSQLFDSASTSDRIFHIHVENHFDVPECGPDGEQIVMLP